MNIYTIKTKKYNVIDEKLHTTFTDHDISFPSDINEITLLQWCNLHTIRHKHLPDFVKENEKLTKKEQEEKMGTWNPKQWSEFYTSIAFQLSAFTTSDISSILEMNLTSDVGDGLLAIYFSIIGMINSYEPKIREFFEYKGHKYILSKPRTDQFSTIHYGEDIKTGNAIEALQYEHIFSPKEDGTPIIENAKYHSDLGIITMLSKRLLPDGSTETMPLEHLERRKWIDERIKHFGEIPMTIALDIDFFLVNSNNISLNTLTSLLYSKTSPRKSNPPKPKNQKITGN